MISALSPPTSNHFWWCQQLRILYFIITTTPSLTPQIWEENVQQGSYKQSRMSIFTFCLRFHDSFIMFKNLVFIVVVCLVSPTTLRHREAQTGQSTSVPKGRGVNFKPRGKAPGVPAVAPPGLPAHSSLLWSLLSLAPWALTDSASNLAFPSYFFVL